MEFLDRRKGLLGLQRLVTRKGDEAARLRCLSGGPPGSFLTAIQGGRMKLGHDMFVVTVWYRLRHHVRADVAPPPCKCSAGVAAEAGLRRSAIR